MSHGLHRDNFPKESFTTKLGHVSLHKTHRASAAKEQEHNTIPPPASDFPSWKLGNYNCPSLASTVIVEREISGVQSAVLPQLLSSPSSCAGLQVKVQQHVCRYLAPCIKNGRGRTLSSIYCRVFQVARTQQTVTTPDQKTKTTSCMATVTS